MSSGDVELNIHYSGKTIERRKSEYLMDEDHVDVVVRPRRASIRRNSSFDSSYMEGLVSMPNSIARINSNGDSCSLDSYDQDGSPLLMLQLNRGTALSTFSPLQHSQSGHSLEAINEQSSFDEEMESPTGSTSSTTYNPLSTGRSIAQKDYSKGAGAWDSDLSSMSTMPFSPTIDTRQDKS